MKKHPVYRLMDGQVMSQDLPGGRWTPVDEAAIEGILRAFDGIPYDALSRHAELPIAKPLDR